MCYLSTKTNGDEVPRNVTLLFFTESPERYLRGAYIEVVHFGDDSGGRVIEERRFQGPLPQQVRTTLDFLNGLSSTVIQKVPQQAESLHFVAFPYEAMEEALVNAVFHRGYESPEPVKVYLYPDRMEITSYPGPVPGLELRHLQPGGHVPPLPARNRRIGELLKELRLAEMRGTGIPTIRRQMSENGSPEPRFDFDEERTYFRVTLPAHPRYVLLHALRESAQLWATGEKERAFLRLEEALRANPTSGALVAHLIDYCSSQNDMANAQVLLARLEQTPGAEDRHLAYIALARAHLDRQQNEDAALLLQNVPKPNNAGEAVELAVLYRRSGQHEVAHRLFAAHYPQIKDSPKAVHEYAQAKLKLADAIHPKSNVERTTQKRLNQEAAELLRRAVQLADNPLRAAWAWCDLAHALSHVKAPESEIREAYGKAIELAPEESRFREWRDEWEKRHHSRKPNGPK